MKKPPIILDIEASGFGKHSYPIEVGFVNAEGETWCSLIKPDPAWSHWDDSAEQVHRINREVLHQYGRDVVEVAGYLNDQLLNCVVYSDGWAHDYHWLNVLLDAANMAAHFRLEDLRHVLTPQQQDLWHPAKEVVSQQLQLERHRASVDARILQLTWLKTAGLDHPIKIA